MDIYEIIAQWAGWPVVTAALILAGGYGYWLLRSHIDILKKENEFLEKKLNDSQNFTPDVLAKRLADRVKLLSEELERMHNDNNVSKEAVAKKEQELFRALLEATEHALARLNFALSETVNLQAIVQSDNTLVLNGLKNIREQIILASEDLRFPLIKKK